MPAGETGSGCGPADRCTPPHTGALHSAPETACSCDKQGLVLASVFTVDIIIIIIVVVIIIIVTIIININSLKLLS